MNQVDELRAAARLMRERAEAARAGIWVADGALVSADWEHEPRAVTLCDGSPVREGNVANAEHIASWHPAIALAVAEWLEDEAFMVATDRARAAAALTVARMYLGGAA